MWDSVYLRTGSQSGGGKYYEWEKFDTLKRNTIASGKNKQRLIMGGMNNINVRIKCAAHELHTLTVVPAGRYV